MTGAPELTFSAVEVVAQPYAVVPTLDVRLRVESAIRDAVRSILLNVAVNILPARRGYDSLTQERLRELFGEPAQWDRTLRPLLWHRPTVVVPAFADSETITVPLPCATDFELATTKYLHAVRDGEVTLELLFSGTLFHSDVDGRLRTSRLARSHEATVGFPVGLWQDLVRRYYGTSRWLRLGQEGFDRLAAYKARRALVSWDDAVNELVLHAMEGEPPWIT